MTDRQVTVNVCKCRNYGRGLVYGPYHRRQKRPYVDWLHFDPHQNLVYLAVGSEPTSALSSTPPLSLPGCSSLSHISLPSAQPVLTCAAASRSPVATGQSTENQNIIRLGFHVEPRHFQHAILWFVDWEKDRTKTATQQEPK